MIMFKSHSTALEAAVDSLFTRQEQIKQLEASIKYDLKTLEDEMDRLGIQKIESQSAVAEFQASKGRATTVVNSVAYVTRYQPGTPEFDAVTIGITKARELLSKKEFDKLATIIPAKPGDPKLVVHSK